MRDIMGLMKQAQAMQQKMQDFQAELEGLEVEGQAGGGAVKVRADGKGKVKSLSIDPAFVKADETEILEDLIVAAIHDAAAKAEAISKQRVAEMTKGLPIPPGMNLF